ncbi:hypothetical protein GCM10009589_02520 [Arthrobacter pascens]
MVVGVAGRAEGTHLQIDVLGQDPAQLGYMDARASVNLRRELFSHNVYSHGTQGSRYG